jgi:hypothetical protein
VPVAGDVKCSFAEVRISAVASEGLRRSARTGTHFIVCSFASVVQSSSVRAREDSEV